MPRSIMVVLGVAVTAMFLVSASSAAPPPNDSFASATVISPSALPFSDTVDMTEARPALFVSCDFIAKASVWYAFTPAVSGDVKILVDSAIPTTVSAFTGPAYNLTQLGCAAFGFGGTGLILHVRPGKTYYFRMSILTTPFGPVTFHLNFAPDGLPWVANDDLDDAKQIASLPFTDVVDNTPATTETDEAWSTSCGPASHTVWYRITAPVDEVVRFSTADSGFTPNELGVYWESTPGYGGIRSLGCAFNGASRQVQLLAGRTYAVQAGSSGSVTGSLRVNATVVVPPANDNFASASPIANVPFSAFLDLGGATTEPGERTPSCASAMKGSAWYGFTPAVTGTYGGRLSSATPFGFVVQYGVYTGSSFGDLTQVACNLGNPLGFDVAKGRTYWIQVANGSGLADVSTFSLELIRAADTTPPVLSVPTSVVKEASGPNGSAVDFTATAVDDVDGSVAVNCSPPAWTVFPLGTTMVVCSAADAAGNAASASFSVTVRDTAAPVVDADLVLQPFAKHGDETDKAAKLFKVTYACSDAVGVVTLSATLNGTSVVSGQFVELRKKHGVHADKVLRDGTLRLSAPAFVLVVTCADAAGNVGRGTANTGDAFPPDGRLVFLSDRSGDREVYVINRDGTGLRRLTFNNMFERAARWSPDGKRIAFAGRNDGNWDIYTINADGSGFRQLTTDPGRDDEPAWANGGASIVYERWTDNDCSVGCSLHMMSSDGTHDHALQLGPGSSFGADVSADNQLAFAGARDGLVAIYTANLSGRDVRQVTPGSLGWDFQPRWSPNGDAIVFLRGNDAGDDNDLFIVHADGSGLVRLTDTPSRVEFSATWAPNGKELVFWTLDGALYSMRPDGTNETRLSSVPAAPLTETFGDGVIDSSLWHWNADAGGTIGESNGQLLASIAHDAQPGGQYNQIDEHVGSQCSLNGDYDYQVDYSLVTWPPHSGFFASLQAIFDGGAIARTSAQWDPPYDEQYGGWTNTPFTFDGAHTSDLYGQMRLIRSNGVLYSYARNGAGTSWTLVHAGLAPGNNVVGMGLSAQAWNFAHKDGAVAFDNFRLNSGVFTCPEWWHDSWPDWRPAPTEGGD